MGKLGVIFLTFVLLNSLKAAAQADSSPKMDTSNKKITLKVLPQNFYSQHLGFFCKKEVQVQKATSLNIFIRLGSKDYVDYLEGKPNARKAD